MYFKEEGIKIELKKEYLYHDMLASASCSNGDRIEEIRKDILKLIFPESKSQDEKLFESVQKLANTNDKIRISVDTKSELNPNLVNTQYFTKQ